ncbi:MAG: Bug family tripartite tricarboxylate transporter substrate binding protein [Thermodesulfobacteriota bacterium]
MRTKSCLLLTMVLSLFLLSHAKEAIGQKEKGAFPTKPVTLIVLTSPGGGWDTGCRFIAEFWRQQLKVPILIKNISGGEQLIGPTTMYNSPPDGYTIGTVSSGAVGPVIAGVTKFDIKKFEWIGILSDDYYITSASLKSGFKNLDDLKKAKRQILIAIPGFATGDAQGALLMREKMGLNLKMVTHEGSTPGILAAIRGDVDLVSSPVTSMKKAVVDAKDLVPLWISSPARLGKLPDLPTLNELGYPEVAKMFALHRLVGAPPGTSPERLEILKKTFRAVLENPKYQSRVREEWDAEINLAQGAEVTRIVEEKIALLKPYEKIVKEGWGKR